MLIQRTTDVWIVTLFRLYFVRTKRKKIIDKKMIQRVEAITSIKVEMIFITTKTVGVVEELDITVE